MLKMLTLLLTVAIPTKFILECFGGIVALIAAIGMAFLTVAVDDFLQDTNGTLRWRWRNFNFKREFTDRYYYAESLYLGVAAWCCDWLAYSIAGLLKRL